MQIRKQNESLQITAFLHCFGTGSQPGCGFCIPSVPSPSLSSWCFPTCDNMSHSLCSPPFPDSPRKEVYFMAIIDILTHYDAKKKAAHAAKTVKHGVSTGSLTPSFPHRSLVLSIACEHFLPFCLAVLSSSVMIVWG